MNYNETYNDSLPLLPPWTQRYTTIVVVSLTQLMERKPQTITYIL